ncbi:MAG: hypothetical protein LBR68_03920 [Lachnoclostridium sp.]|jgi:hypothetical protein|nr:hypothetical protein [Lachnoclostridium sp.]
MTNDLLPVNCSNAVKLIERQSHVINLTMLKYESIFNFYSEEPASIKVEVEEGDEIDAYEQIFRIRKWYTDREMYTWSLYSLNREFEYGISNSLVLRNVAWNVELDTNNLKRRIRENKTDKMNDWPAIKTNNIFLNQSNSILLMKELSKFDALTEKGIVISDNPNPIWNCRDKEVRRLFNWGQIQYTHSSGKQVESLEEQLLRLEYLFENQAKLDQGQIHAMFLNYSYLPEVYKKYL